MTNSRAAVAATTAAWTLPWADVIVMSYVFNFSLKPAKLM
jgi:hypothetical protein